MHRPSPSRLRRSAASACIAALAGGLHCANLDVGDATFAGAGATSSATSASDDEVPSPTTVADPSTGTDTGSGSAADETHPGPEVLLDVGGWSHDLGTAFGCSAIDFLFVVDDSGSMQTYQAALVDSFPAFVAGIHDSLETVDGFHVAVTTSDAYVYNTPECGWLGSSVVKTGGEYSSAQDCGPYAEGHNYMTDADDLATTFACAAKVGTGGDPIERPMGAVVNAMSNTTPGTAPCNDDFLRTDALLVIVIISDEYDGPDDPEGDGSLGTPAVWYDVVVEAKGGHPENVAVVTLTSYDGGPCPPRNPGYDGVHMVAFTEMFGDHGFVAGICEADYAASFAQAVDVVVEACADFVPPG